MTTILVFTKRGCPYCSELIERLRVLAIPFKDVDIVINQDLWNYLKDQTGSDLLPTVYIQQKKDSSGLVYVPERNFNSIDEIVEIVEDQYTEKEG